MRSPMGDSPISPSLDTADLWTTYDRDHSKFAMARKRKAQTLSARKLPPGEGTKQRVPKGLSARRGAMARSARRGAIATPTIALLQARGAARG